jgi:hypothetical protein
MATLKSQARKRAIEPNYAIAVPRRQQTTANDSQRMSNEQSTYICTMRHFALIALIGLASCQKEQVKPSGSTPSPAPQWTGSAPQPIAPAQGTTGVWMPISWEWVEVPQAHRYEIQATMQTLSGHTNPLLTAWSLTSSPYIQNHSLSSTYNGADARWRIRAVGSNDQVSEWSEWVEFNLGQ